MIAGKRVQANAWVDPYWETQFCEDGKTYQRREYASGTITYWHNTALSRDNKPARFCHDGTIEWYQAGRRHRTDGPAVEFTSGDVSWHWCGYQMHFAEYIIAAKWTDEQIVEFKLTRGLRCIM